MPAFLPSNQFSLLPLSHRNDDSESRLQWILLLLAFIMAIFTLGMLAQPRSPRPAVRRRVKSGRSSLAANLSATSTPKAEVHSAPTTLSHANATQSEKAQDEELQSAESQYSETNPLNLNTASATQLELLPGVGPAMAEKILTAREEKGGFKSIEDLGEVPGIGEKTMDKLRPLVTA